MQHDTNRVPWDSLKYFVAVATAGSLRRAAETLGISAPTLSRHMQSLEEGFGCMLFHRRAGGFEMTEQGRDILERCLGIDAMVRTLMLAVSSTSRSTVRISTLTCIGKFVVLPLLSTFLERHPCTHVDVAWDAEEPDDFCFDIAIRYTRPTQGHYIVRRIGYVELDTWVRTSERALDDVPTIVVGRAAGEDTSRGPRIQLEDYHSLLDAVRAGLGKGTIADFVARRFPELQRVPDQPSEPRREVWMIIREEAERRPEVRHLADLIIARLSNELKSPSDRETVSLSDDDLPLPIRRCETEGPRQPIPPSYTRTGRTSSSRIAPMENPAPAPMSR